MKSTEDEAGDEKPGKEHKDYFKSYSNFLYPRIPGKFFPDRLRRRPAAWLKKRYLKTFRATMGNHSMALYYCAWEPSKFREMVAADPDFALAIDDAKAEVADRAAFMLHRGMGLIAGEEGTPDPTPQAGAVLLKIAESMIEKKPAPEPSKKKSFRLTVSGLKRPGDAPDSPIPPTGP